MDFLTDNTDNAKAAKVMLLGAFRRFGWQAWQARCGAVTRYLGRNDIGVLRQSLLPNAEVCCADRRQEIEYGPQSGDLYVVARRDIPAGEQITVAKSSMI